MLILFISIMFGIAIAVSLHALSTAQRARNAVLANLMLLQELGRTCEHDAKQHNKLVQFVRLMEMDRHVH